MWHNDTADFITTLLTEGLIRERVEGEEQKGKERVRKMEGRENK